MSKLFFCLSRTCLFGAVVALLQGCGGGGGGGGTSGGGGVGVLTVFANLTPGTSGGPVGASEVIQIKTISGSLVQSQTINKGSSTGSQQVNFNGLPSATLLVHGILYSGANGTGSATGTFDTSVAGGTAQFISTAVAQPITLVAVSPSTASVAKGATTQMLASAQDTSGDFVFNSTAATWSSSATGVATVSSSGLVTGVSAGQTTITATINKVQATSSVVVTGITTGTWTILVYMNAANDLDAWSIVNELQMEKIAQTPTSQTRFVIQWKLSDSPSALSQDLAGHPFNGTQRFVEVANGRELVQDMGAGVDMGSATTLKNFVAWGVQNYPASHYALVMWDHGDGWNFRIKNKLRAQSRAISYDYETGNHIEVNQLAQAITPTHLDILAFDACQMQMLEVADEVKGVANLMVGAEDNTPAPGYPYDTAFAPFFSTPTASSTTLATGIVDAFIKRYNLDPTYGSLPLSNSVVDLTKTTAEVSALNTFANALLADSTVGSNTQTVRSQLINYAAGNGFFYYDVGSIGRNFAATASPSSVTSAATNLFAAETASVIYSKTNVGSSGQSLSPNSTGLSVEFGPSSQFTTYATDYAQLQLAQGTNWAKFLANSTVNP